MAATPRNPPPAAGATPEVINFPDSPSPGSTVYHTGFGAAFVWSGSRWRVQDGGAAIYPAGVGLFRGAAVLLVDGSLELLDTDVHDAATGVVAALVDGDAMVRWLGEIDDLDDLGLAENGVYYATAGEPGLLTQTPDSGKDLIRMARANTATRLFVSVEIPVLA